MQTFKSKNLDIFFVTWTPFVLAGVLFLQTFNSLGSIGFHCKEFTWVHGVCNVEIIYIYIMCVDCHQRETRLNIRRQEFALTLEEINSESLG